MPCRAPASQTAFSPEIAAFRAAPLPAAHLPIFLLLYIIGGSGGAHSPVSSSRIHFRILRSRREICTWVVLSTFRRLALGLAGKKAQPDQQPVGRGQAGQDFISG